jgi:tetratricopeptide (TPR) repeat protein
MNNIPKTIEECYGVLDFDMSTGRKRYGHVKTAPIILNLMNEHKACSFVEVGSQTSYLSGLVAKVFPESQVYCVDINFSRPNLHEQYSNMTQITGDSAKTALDFEDLSIDISYIDALHTYDAVRGDLHAWWPKTKKILAGHDYNHSDFPGCTNAINEFCVEKKLKINTEEYNNFWVVKQEDISQPPDKIEIALANKASLQNLDTLFELGVQAFSESRWTQARKVCKAILGVDLQSAKTQHLLGLVAMKQERLSEAEELIRSALVENPNDGVFENSLGAVLNQQERTSEALQCFENSIEKNPGYLPAYDNLIRAYIKGNDHRSVLKHAYKAKQVSSNDLKYIKLIKHLEANLNR